MRRYHHSVSSIALVVVEQFVLRTILYFILLSLLLTTPRRQLSTTATTTTTTPPFSFALLTNQDLSSQNSSPTSNLNTISFNSTSDKETSNNMSTEKSLNHNNNIIQSNIYDDPFQRINTTASLSYSSDLQRAISQAKQQLQQDNEFSSLINCPTCGLNDSNCDTVHFCYNHCGRIKSMNYPSNYVNNHRCRWHIKAPKKHYVNLTIIDFDIPSSNNNASKLGNCIFDYLTIIEGYTGKRLGCYCNENLPPKFIVSPWEELIIQIDTNSETTGKGFDFYYKFMKLELTDKIKKQMEIPTNIYMSSSKYSYNLNKHSHIPDTFQVCPDGWIYFRNSCYKAYNEPEPLQWYDAEKKCNKRGDGLDGHLVSILDRDEMLVILYLLTNDWNSTMQQDYYIGLIDVSREGVYRWSDNNPMSYTDWEVKPILLEEEIPAQPDGGAYEDCTVIRYSSSWRTSNWHDVPCSLGKHYHTHLGKRDSLANYNPHDYVNSFICKSDSIASLKRRRPLYNDKIRNINDMNDYLKALDSNKYFICDNSEVISVVLKCDGVTHCRDGSDESDDCDPDNCFHWQFKCANGGCTSIGNYCNFVDDCGDGSDESRCERPRCKLSDFQCQSGQCIENRQRCDLLTDCSDNSDEGTLCTIGSNCNTASTFQCYNGNCIPLYAVCDFQIDCPGKFHEDEDAATCDIILKNRLLENKFNSSSPPLIGYNPTNDSSRSKTNNALMAARSPDTKLYPLLKQINEPNSMWIKQNLFRCRSGNLIQNNLRCLYEFDRYGYQIGCRDVTHLINCENFTCPQRDYVKCPNSYCIPWRYICDGKWDCPMGDDELGCARYLCPGQYKCANQSSCILLHQLCDGHRQCPMGDDEWFCDLQCDNNNCNCIGQSVNCTNANLTSLPNPISKSIRKLDLSYNRLGPNLTNCDFSAFHDLGELILHHNNIEVLIPRKFHALRNLYKLDLSNNQIHSVRRGAFAGLRKVTQLLLESNPELIIIEQEAFLGLSSLQMLNISSSRILTLKKNTFDGLTSLRHLLLRDNMINEIEDDAFTTLNSLVSLDMRGNEIRKFTRAIFKDLKSLRNLSTDSFKFCCLMTHQVTSDHCLPLPDEISDCEDLLSSRIQSTCIWIFGILAIIGNIIVICWRVRDRRQFYKDREGKKVNSTLLLSLACSDLLMGIYLILIAIADSYYRGSYIENADIWRESIWCNLCGFLVTVSSLLSVLTLVCIAYNRFDDLCYPFKDRPKLTLHRIQIMIFFFWLIALTIAAIPTILTSRGQSYPPRSGVCLAFHISPKATGWFYYSNIIFSMPKLLALIVIVVSYIKISMHISREGKEISAIIMSRESGETNPMHISREASEMNSKLRNIYKIFIILVTHFMAWLPIITIEVLSMFKYPISALVYSWIAVLVLPVNSAINPWIYTIPSIQQKVKEYIQQHKANKAVLSKGQTNGVLELKPLPRQKLDQRNIPPGYIPLAQFINKTHLTEYQLIEIAQKIARDIEEKHSEKRVYETLNLDNIFVSYCTVLPKPEVAILSNGQQPSNGTKVGAIPGLFEKNLNVFLADHNGYRRKKPCRHEKQSSLNNGLARQKPLVTTAKCECADLQRLGNILHKKIQLYKNRKLDHTEDTTTIVTTTKQ